jgi:protein-disulfide isomerase
MTRRRLLGLLALFAILASPIALGVTRRAVAAGAVDIEAILNDPAAPVTGNAAGDVTIVAFMDYNCTFCKKSSPDLERFVDTDGAVRLVYKEWPILAPSSVYGARLALAAKYQGKYHEAHLALMGVRGGSVAEASMLDAVKAAGVNMDRLDEDLKAHDADIMALIKRDKDQADSLGLQATPVFLIGPYKVEKALDYDEFKQIVADFRARVAK